MCEQKRKAERMKKRKPSNQMRTIGEQRSSSSSAGGAKTAISSGPLKKALGVSSSSSSSSSEEKGKTGKKGKKDSSDSGSGSVPSHFLAVHEDPEDKEIARLEKLLGVTSQGGTVRCGVERESNMLCCTALNYSQMLSDGRSCTVCCFHSCFHLDHNYHSLTEVAVSTTVTSTPIPTAVPTPTAPIAHFEDDFNSVLSS